MTLVFLCLSWFALALLSLFPMHMFQLESYQFPGYFRVLKSETKRMFLPNACITAVGLLVTFLSAFVLEETFPVPCALFLCALISFALSKKRKAKKPFVFTQRAQRLFALIALTQLVFVVLCAFLFTDLVRAILLSILPLFVPFFTALGAYFAQPIEKRINLGFYKDAQRILSQRTDLIKIGITGSYGKTSTKFILKTLLDEKYCVLATPSSFNTPMGITRVVREQLKPEHQVFLAEMGARHRGDIRELTDLVHPTVGLITSVGKQHLETMHSIENVAATKFELIEALPREGAAFFAADGAYCEGLFELGSACQKTLAGLNGKGSVYADEISVGPRGSSFTLHTPMGCVKCETTLLGLHNIQNITLAAACALHLGLTLSQVQSGISKLVGVEHRMQLIQGANGNTVIDDAFNANPAGAKAAVEILSGFPGRRIIVTPGMVELGQEEEALNRAFGTQIARGVDVALLIGENRTKPIVQGLMEAGFPKEKTVVLATLDEATLWLQKNGRMGDVVLFENDLPDNY